MALWRNSGGFSRISDARWYTVRNSRRGNHGGMSVRNFGSPGGLCPGGFLVMLVGLQDARNMGGQMPGCILNTCPEVPRDAWLDASDKLWDANIGP